MKSLDERLSQLMSKEFYTKSTPSMQRKFETLIKHHHPIASYKIFRFYASGLGLFVLIYLITRYNTYLEYFTSFFTYTPSAAINAMDKWMLIAGVIIGTVLYYINKRLEETKKSLEPLREKLVKNYDGSFCTCSKGCNCKEEAGEYFHKQEDIEITF